MLKTGSWSGAVWVLAVLAALLVGRSGLAQSPGPASAPAGVIGQCVDAHLANQQLRKANHLRAAKDQLLICVQEGCPDPIKADCAGWIAELDAQIPSIVIAGVDAAGKDTTDVRVTIDGIVHGDRLNGVAVSLDPGPHEIGCEHKGATIIEKLVAVQAQKSRVVVCSFAVATPPPPPPGSDAPVERGQPVVGYVLGVLSVGAFVAFAALGTIGKGEADDLDNSCGDSAPAPFTKTCTDEQISPVRNKLIAADVSLGVGVALFAVSLGLILSHFLSEPDDGTPQAVRVDLGPTPHGAAGQLTVRF